MSKIITPTDAIHITIDNRTGQVQMATSRELPTAYTCFILAQLISRIEQQVMSGVLKPASELNPFEELSRKEKDSSNGTS